MWNPGISPWLLFFVMAFSGGLRAQSCTEVTRLLSALETYHYRPVPLDDALSARTYDGFLEELDPDHLFWLKEDMDALHPFREQLDDELRTGDCGFIREVTQRFQVRLQQVDSLLDQLGGGTSSLEGPPGEFPDYAADLTELADRWERWVSYQAFGNLSEDREQRDWEKEKYQLLEEAIQREHCYLHELLFPKEELGYQVQESFLNTLSQCFDPHTQYFSGLGRETFKNALSSEAYSFGFELKKNAAGEIEIAHLIPGGSAWKSNQLNKGDLLLKLKLPGEAPLDLFCADVYAIEELLYTTEADSLVITVKKRSGQIRSVVLYKEKLQVEENIVSGFILQGALKAGYIYLPGFYTEWENQEGQGCAEDVGRELLKLQMEGIEGLVLDLRNNGGGSLQEAMDLAGIFINEGPLCISMGRNREPSLMKDANRGTMFNGPLVLLVNGLSASASELLAASLQDYRRAVVLGSPTFGKASGQVVLPLGFAKNAGSVKVTTQRFYRLNGKTLQKKGVMPDILLPEPLDFIIPREEDYSSALPNDSVEKKVVFRPLAPLPWEDLALRSRERLSTDQRFQQVNALNLALGQYNDQRNMEDEHAAQKRREALVQLETLDSLLHHIPNAAYRVQNHQFNNSLLELDMARRLMNQQQLQKIQNDLFVEEAYRVLSDLVEVSRN